MKLSIIIVNYNVKYFLEQCLHSCDKAISQMKRKHSDWDAEIFVVDNNSVDGSVEMLRERFTDVKLIANTDNKGFSRANNQAIHVSKGEYVLLLNPDTVVEEDTFLKSVEFMENTPDAGGLGVKMLDGKGDFLPESKRGLPTPDVAFYKIFGFSSLFPKSKVFGKYHLGFLDENDTNPVDVLAGAFMLLRKKTLDKIGLLDETFFMYGEDIDLSYRITQSGYKNYFFPHTRIIHYKGESTKKDSVNYVFVFYNAMIIFAKKHFSTNNAKLFAFLINLAIYFRAGISIFTRFIKGISHPALDWAFNLFLLTTATHWYEHNVKFENGETYPDAFFNIILPIYSLIWVFGIAATGSYTWIYQTKRMVKGVLIGTVMVALFYAILNEEFRFSRAVILIGTLLSISSFYLTRWIIHLIKEGSIFMGKTHKKRMVIVGSESESNRVETLLEQSGVQYKVLGKVNPKDEAKKGFLGSARQLKEIVQIHKINEVIFCSKDMRSTDIFNQMLAIRNPHVFYKIVPEQSLFIIGSNSKDQQGDYYTIDIKLALKSPENQFNKRLLDIVVSSVLLVLSPILIWLVDQKNNFILNIFKVLLGKLTWVSYTKNIEPDISLPSLKNGVITPSERYSDIELELKAINRIDMAYARNYHFSKDLDLIFRGFSKLGN